MNEPKLKQCFSIVYLCSLSFIDSEGIYNLNLIQESQLPLHRVPYLRLVVLSGLYLFETELQPACNQEEYKHHNTQFVGV